MDYKGEFRLVFVARLPSALVDSLLRELDRSAYKKNHSTESALIKVQGDIPRAIDNNCWVILLLLDLSAAFDTHDHRILVCYNSLLALGMLWSGSAHTCLLGTKMWKWIVTSLLVVSSAVVYPRVMSVDPFYSCFTRLHWVLSRDTVISSSTCTLTILRCILPLNRLPLSDYLII